MKRSTLDLGSGDGKQQVVCMAEGACRLEVNKAKVGSKVVAQEADVAELGEGLGDVQLLQEGGASALESEVNLRAHFVAGVVEVVVLGICVQRLGWICEGDVNWICGQAA